MVSFYFLVFASTYVLLRMPAVKLNRYYWEKIKKKKRFQISISVNLKTHWCTSYIWSGGPVVQPKQWCVKFLMRMLICLCHYSCIWIVLFFFFIWALSFKGTFLGVGMQYRRIVKRVVTLRPQGQKCLHMYCQIKQTRMNKLCCADPPVIREPGV